MTKERLTETLSGDGFTYTPVINHIDEDENIVAIIRGGLNDIKIGRKEKSPDRGGEIVYVPTDKRLLIIIPEGEQDTTEELPYEDVENIDGDTQSGFLTSEYIFKINTSGPKYQLELRDDARSETLVDILRERANEDYEFVVNSPQYDNSDVIEVIDRETGEAKMESKGWNYGISFIE